jgi:hypothetical protein
MEQELRRTILHIMKDYEFETYLLDSFRNYIKNGCMRTPDNIINNQLFVTQLLFLKDIGKLNYTNQDMGHIIMLMVEEDLRRS